MGPADEEWVTRLLARLAEEDMPVEIVERLDAVLAGEARRRTSGQAHHDQLTQLAAHAKRASLGTFENGPTKRYTGFATPWQPFDSSWQIVSRSAGGDRPLDEDDSHRPQALDA